jgi:SAM-dependent methyltransferase
MVTREFTSRLSWEEKARINPLWAVMSVSEFSDADANPDSWTSEQLELFFDKGQLLFDVFLQPPLLRTGLLASSTFAVEYGSGMGRILRAIKGAGLACAGVDISATMLEHSRRLVPEVEQLYLLEANGRVPMADECADFVYSYAVLQHIAQTSKVRRAVLEMCRLLKPGGLIRLQFQPSSMPFSSAPQGASWGFNFEHRSLVYRRVRLQSRLSVPQWVPRVPLVWLQRHDNWTGVPLRWQAMHRFLREGGVRLLSLERDPAADWNSVWLLGRKER